MTDNDADLDLDDVPNSEEIANAAADMGESLDIGEEAMSEAGEEAAEGGQSLSDLLWKTPEKSVKEADSAEIWSPEHGAEDRLALCAETISNQGRLPVILQLPIALGELFVKYSDEFEGIGTEAEAADQQEDEKTLAELTQ